MLKDSDSPIKVLIRLYKQQGMKCASYNQFNVQPAHGNEDDSRLTPCEGDTEHVQSSTTLCLEDVLTTAMGVGLELLFWGMAFSLKAM